MEFPSWDEVAVELRQVANWLNSLEPTQTQLVTAIFASSLVIYASIVIKPGGPLMWLTLSTMSLCGLVASGWNLWVLKEHLNSFDHFWNLILDNEPSKVNAVNLGLLLLLLVLWIWQEAAYWKLSWKRTILMWLMALGAPTLGVPMLISHVVSIEAEIPRGSRVYRRLLHLYVAIGLAAILLATPMWVRFAGDAAAMKGHLASPLQFALVNWASSVVSRSLAIVLPPLCAWAIYNSNPFLALVLIPFALFSAPALIAGILILREVRSRHQQNKNFAGDGAN